MYTGAHTSWGHQNLSIWVGEALKLKVHNKPCTPTSMVWNKFWPFFKGKQKEAITLKPERPRPPESISMHFTTISTCTKFLSQFYFLTSMDYSPGPKGKFGHFKGKQKTSNISATREATPPNLVCMHIQLILLFAVLTAVGLKLIVTLNIFYLEVWLGISFVWRD